MSFRRILPLFACLVPLSRAHAATLKVSPASPQPGDALSVTVVPASGEEVQAVGMSAFDTAQVKFYRRADGTARAFVGLPFDRAGGTFPLAARVQVKKNGRTSEQTVRVTIVARARYYPRQNIRMRNGNENKMNSREAMRREKLHVQSKMRDSYAAPLWSGSWVVPSRGRETSSYGMKRTVNGRPWGQHNGADVKAPSGTPVVAANAGRVVLSEYLPALRGNCIVIDHGCNVFSVYMHLSKRDIVEGASVNRGQRIGAVGATGFVTGPHLHWEVRLGWEPIDPVRVLQRGFQF
jgi:murein DD-endopeptidase MepM/ murein hydrolase activator NlpD